MSNSKWEKHPYGIEMCRYEKEYGGYGARIKVDDKIADIPYNTQLAIYALSKRVTELEALNERGSEHLQEERNRNVALRQSLDSIEIELVEAHKVIQKLFDALVAFNPLMERTEIDWTTRVKALTAAREYLKGKEEV